MEIWKDVPGYEGMYQVSDIGNVRNVIKDRQLKIQDSGTGYKKVVLFNKGVGKNFLIHKLVAISFLDHVPNGKSKDSIIIDHINENKHDNRVCNLQLVTQRQNTSKNRLIRNNEKPLGLYFDDKTEKWKCNIFIEGKLRHLGYYISKEEAILAREEVLNEYLKFGIIKIPSLVKHRA